MPRRFDRNELARCGTITTTELEPAGKNDITLRRTRYAWRPTAQLAAQLPPDFELALVAVVGRDGTRIFREAADEKVAIFQGFAAGLALLDQLRSFTREQRLQYRAPFWFYQYVQETQAHLDCNFLSRPQLLIRPGSRSETGECDVLPADLGYDSSGRGPRWTIERLLSEGAQDAREALGQRPTMAEQISFGLMAAALRNPLQRKHRTILMTAYAAGLRIFEAASLRVSDLDSQRMVIRVVQGKRKKDRYTMRSRRILVAHCLRVLS